MIDAHQRGVDLRRRYGVHALQHPFDPLELVDAVIAPALHTEQAYLEACRLVAEARADVSATVAVADRNRVRTPVTCEVLDAIRRDAAFLCRPFGRLRHAILVAEHVVLKPVEALDVRFHVFLVVEAFGHPHVDDGQLERCVGVGEYRDPLVGMDCVRVVAVGCNVDGLHADLVEPIAQAACLLAAPAPRRGLRVGTPEQKGIGILAHVFDDVVLRVLLAMGLHAPDVLGAPVPTLPAVGLASLDQVFALFVAAVVEHERTCAMGAGHDLGLAMALALDKDRGAAVYAADALDLGSDDVRCLVPADALVSGNAAVLRIDLLGVAAGLPVHALQRIRYAVGRVRATLVRQRDRRQERLHARTERMAAHLVAPLVQLLGGVMLVVVQRANAHDLAVFHVNASRVRAAAEPAKPQVLKYGTVLNLHESPPFPITIRKIRQHIL